MEVSNDNFLVRSDVNPNLLGEGLNGLERSRLLTVAANGFAEPGNIEAIKQKDYHLQKWVRPAGRTQKKTASTRGRGGLLDARTVFD